MTNILTKLQDMTPEELAIVEGLINKISQKDDSDEKIQQGSYKRRNKKVKIIDDLDDLNDLNDLDDPDETDIIEEGPPPQRQKRRKGKGRNNNRGRPDKGIPTQKEHMRIDYGKEGRPNHFLTSEFVNKHKNDVAIDKKLSGRNKPEERRQTTSLVEVECNVCEYVYDIHPSTFYIDPGTRIPVFTCNDCIRDK